MKGRATGPARHQSIVSPGYLVLSTALAGHQANAAKLVLFMMIGLIGLGCSKHAAPPATVAKPPIRSLDEIRDLPVGLKISHSPNPVYAVRGGRSGRDYTWSYNTTVMAMERDLTIVEFGSFSEVEGAWVFSTVTGKPFSKADFAEWYSCPDAVLRREIEASDPHNWAGGDQLTGARTIWYFIGEDNEGNRFYGEGEIELVDELEGSP